MSCGFLLMSNIGFFIPIDGHVLNKTNLNNQTKLRYYKTKDLLYILSVALIPYQSFCYLLVIMVILLYVTKYIICRICVDINNRKIQDKDENSNAQSTQSIRYKWT